VLPYGWALVRLGVGERPWLWKLGLLPWAVVLVGALHALLRRFARGLEAPGTWLLVLSPALLPSFNLMLDVPALALGLASVAVFLRAAGRSSFALAAWAGLLAGLSMQTKYTGFLAPGAMLLYATLRGRLRLWPAAALAAAQVFVTWEFLVALLYGQSHFLTAWRQGGGNVLAKVNHLPFLFSYLGGVAPAGILMGLAALGLRRRWLAAGAGLALGGYALIALLDVRFVSRTAPAALVFGPGPPPPPVEFQLAEVIFYVFSLAGAAVVSGVAWRLLAEDGRRPRARARRCGTLFLLAWLALEVVGYLLLTPFPALRRVLGVAVVLSLLVASLAARTCRGAERRLTLQALSAGSIALGLAFFGLDWRGACVHRQAAEEAAGWVRDHGGGTAWYVGHWGFQFYAERAGMQPVVPGASRLRRGDWLVVPDSRLNQQGVYLDETKLTLEDRLTVEASVPLSTVPCFYGGRTPLEHHEGSRLEVRIYRVTEDFIPAPGEAP
jgi:hypothetical protein